MLSKIKEYNKRLSLWFEWIGIVAILLMMTITCVDVIGAKVFKMPILGSLDMVQLAQILAISFAGGITLIMGRHIQVEYFFYFLPRPVQSVISSVMFLLGLGLFVVIIWQVCVLAYSFQTSGEYSMTAYIPYYPFAYAIAFAFIPICIELLLKFLGSLKREEQK